MLRITMGSQTNEEVALKIEGWISEENICVLEEEGEHWLRRSERLALELSGVQFIDDKGIEFLQRWKRDRVVLLGASPFVHALLKAHDLI